eukprot:PhF_6_TR11546/c0_g1_i1/m.18546
MDSSKKNSASITSTKSYNMLARSINIDFRLPIFIRIAPHLLLVGISLYSVFNQRPFCSSPLNILGGFITLLVILWQIVQKRVMVSWRSMVGVVTVILECTSSAFVAIGALRTCPAVSRTQLSMQAWVLVSVVHMLPLPPRLVVTGCILGCTWNQLEDNNLTWIGITLLFLNVEKQVRAIMGYDSDGSTLQVASQISVITTTGELANVLTESQEDCAQVASTLEEADLTSDATSGVGTSWSALMPLRPQEDEASSVSSNGTTTKARQLRDVFIAQVSDELRTPVSAMCGMIDVMKSEKGEQTSALNWTTMDCLASQLLVMIDNLVDVASVTVNGAASLSQPIPSQFELIVEKLITNVNLKLASRRITYVPFLDPKLACRSDIGIDPRRFNQIFANLMEEIGKCSSDSRAYSIDFVLHANSLIVVTISAKDSSLLPALTKLAQCNAETVTSHKFRVGITACIAALRASGGSLNLSNERVEVKLECSTGHPKHFEFSTSCHAILVGPSLPQSCSLLTRYLEELNVKYEIVHRVSEIGGITSASVLFCSASHAHELRETDGRIVVIAERHSYGYLREEMRRELVPSEIPWPFFPYHLVQHLTQCLEVSEEDDDDEVTDTGSNHSSEDISKLNKSTEKRRIVPASILIVESNTVIRRVMEKKLDMMFREVVCVTTPEEALQRVCQHSPGMFDAILVDIEMSSMSGFELTRVFRTLEKERRWKRTIIIACTANVSGPGRQECLAAGMDDYISKPLDSDKLLFILKHQNVIR